MKKIFLIISFAFIFYMIFTINQVYGGQYSISVGKQPMGLTINEKTQRVYVTNYESNSVTVIDVKNNANLVLHTIHIADSKPWAIVANQETNRLYVANQLKNTISVIDTTNDEDRIIDTIQLPSNLLPTDLAINKITNRLYVSSWNNETILVIDVSNDRNLIIKNILHEAKQSAIAINEKTNKLYVVNYEASTITVYDASDDLYTFISIIYLQDVAPNNIVVNENFNKIYVTNWGASTVSVINTLDDVNELQLSISAFTHPNGIAIDKSTNRAYVTLWSSNEVVIINLNNNVPITRIPVGEKPSAIAISQINKMAYITNSADNTLTFLELTGIEVYGSSGGCLIATATYGTELAPQIQLLREIRDNTVLGTNSGAAFMSTFNAFYYTFSPSIADLERQNLMFKEMVKVAITPLITILSILQFADIDSEFEMIAYGIGILGLNFTLYLFVPLLVCFKLKSKFVKNKSLKVYTIN